MLCAQKHLDFHYYINFNHFALRLYSSNRNVYPLPIIIMIALCVCVSVHDCSSSRYINRVKWNQDEDDDDDNEKSIFIAEVVIVDSNLGRVTCVVSASDRRPEIIEYQRTTMNIFIIGTVI